MTRPSARLALCLVLLLPACGNTDKDGTPSDPPGTDSADEDSAGPIDADGDGYAAGDDCDDDDPDVHPGAEDVWYDGVDSDCAGDHDYDADGDGSTVVGSHPDCDDTDPTVSPYLEEDCSSGVDDDCDEGVDCRDSDCEDDAACAEICDNGVDDDDDGLVDCEDGECADVEGCYEICDNGVDDDDDGLVDCEQTACLGQDACPALTVQINGGVARRWWSYNGGWGRYGVDAAYLSGTAWARTSGGGSGTCHFENVKRSFTGSLGSVVIRERSGVVTGDCGVGSYTFLPFWHTWLRSTGDRGWNGWLSPWWSSGWVETTTTSWYSQRVWTSSGTDYDCLSFYPYWCGGGDWQGYALGGTSHVVF